VRAILITLTGFELLSQEHQRQIIVSLFDVYVTKPAKRVHLISAVQNLPRNLKPFFMQLDPGFEVTDIQIWITQNAEIRAFQLWISNLSCDR
jgi:hypothetical protein